MYNFLAVGGEKYGVSDFTLGSHGKIVSVEEALINFNLPLCWAGNYKITLLKHCRNNNIKFYNLDSGYFGNAKSKIYRRVSINDFQDCNDIVSRPDDRLKKCGLTLRNYKRGSSIVIVPPDYKKAHVLRINVQDWIDEVCTKIKKYTDRPIRVRERPTSRLDRVISDTFSNFIAQDTWCVVGHSSNALVESIINGIPAIALGSSATKSLDNSNLAEINNISNIDNEKRHAWLCHLSYRQFTNQELRSGLAWELLHC